MSSSLKEPHKIHGRSNASSSPLRVVLVFESKRKHNETNSSLDGTHLLLGRIHCQVVPRSRDLILPDKLVALEVRSNHNNSNDETLTDLGILTPTQSTNKSDDGLLDFGTLCVLLLGLDSCIVLESSRCQDTFVLQPHTRNTVKLMKLHNTGMMNSGDKETISENSRIVPRNNTTLATRKTTVPRHDEHNETKTSPPPCVDVAENSLVVPTRRNTLLLPTKNEVVPSVQENKADNKQKTETASVDDEIMKWLPPIMSDVKNWAHVPLDDLKDKFDSCIRNNDPSPLHCVSQILPPALCLESSSATTDWNHVVAKAVLESPRQISKALLQDHQDDNDDEYKEALSRRIQLQVGTRLVLFAVLPNLYASGIVASVEKKKARRKQVRTQTVVQHVSEFLELAPYVLSPNVPFCDFVHSCIPPALGPTTQVQEIYHNFDLRIPNDDDNESIDKKEEEEPPVPNKWKKKRKRLTSSVSETLSSNASLNSQEPSRVDEKATEKQKDKPAAAAKENNPLGLTRQPLTAPVGRGNALLKDSKHVYVSNYLNSNMSNLFRQVPARPPPPQQTKTKHDAATTTAQRRSNVAKAKRPSSKRKLIVSETPVKPPPPRVQETPRSSKSQSARLVAQAALAATRRRKR